VPVTELIDNACPVLPAKFIHPAPVLFTQTELLKPVTKIGGVTVYDVPEMVPVPKL
jgi:hypothetical protein